jgi:molecular chaperone GrpE
VVKDKRKIDGSGRPKNPTAATAESGEAQAAPAGEQAAVKGAKPGATTGQPGKTVPGETPPAPGATDATAAAETGPAKEGERQPTGEAAAVGDGQEEAAAGAVSAPAGGALGAELAALRSELDERLRDLQRVTAEYANYRKRVERDRGIVAEQAVAGVVGALLPILDDLDRAREHGDLVGPFGLVAEQLNGALAKFGLTGFGEPGDPFDPTRHEAVAHQTSAEVTEPTCVAVMRRGYLLGDRLLRAAMVAVADPE